MPQVGISGRLLLETERVSPCRTGDGRADARGSDLNVRRLSIFTGGPTSAFRRGGIVTLEIASECLTHELGDAAAGECQDTGYSLGLSGARFYLLSPFLALERGKACELDALASELRAAFEKLAAEKTPSPTERQMLDLQSGFAQIDFDRRDVLVANGYKPSLNEPKFISQMLYTVVASVNASFERALGREIITGLDRADKTRVGILELNPWVPNTPQSWYDRDSNSLNFGFFPSREDSVGYSPGALMFNALSHDVIVHEFCHAALDSIRPNLILPTNVDVPAFHEAYSDLIAIFQRFGYDELLNYEIAAAAGKLSGLDLLNSLASSVAQTLGVGKTIRDMTGEAMYDSSVEEPHARGEILVQAVYRAFQSVAEKRIADVVSLATGGTGILQPGALPEPLVHEMSRQVRKTAQMFQMMLIRALDYCPPVGIDFFAFLRGVIAADVRLVPQDTGNIRLAWMEAFRFHHIFSPNSRYYSDESLAGGILVAQDGASGLDGDQWKIDALSFGRTNFSGNPGRPLSMPAALAQASEVARILGEERWLKLIFGDDAMDHLTERRVEILSLRSFARPGPQGFTDFGTSIELIGRPLGNKALLGDLAIDGATLMFDSDGRLVSRASRIADEVEITRALQFAKSQHGRHFWTVSKDQQWQLHGQLAKRMCMH